MPRLRTIAALSVAIALIGCSSGGTGGATSGDAPSMQKSSRILKRKKPETSSAMSRPARPLPGNPAY